ncbi:MAG: hypothetical protein JJE25_01455 [Bacteroidia bacterium]|nr:hypothetical protein [Bacteroidia bacterium]
MQKDAKEKRLRRKDPVIKLAAKLQKQYPILFNEVGTKRVKQILKKVIRIKKNKKVTD